ncbi:MAG: hypothetical protein ACE5FU_08235, partial [Nitrospinota bacterium]
MIIQARKKHHFIPKTILYVLPLLFIACTPNEAPEIKGMIFVPKGKFIFGTGEQDVATLGKEYGNR